MIDNGNIIQIVIITVVLAALGLSIAALIESHKNKDRYIPSSGFYMADNTNRCDCTQCPGGPANALPGTICGGTRPCSSAECAIEPVR